MQKAENRLEFQWRDGNLEIKAAPKYLVKISGDEENVTIDFLRHYKNDGWDAALSIGYFIYNDVSECWDLYFVDDRFKTIPAEQAADVWRQLGRAYDTLTIWKRGERDRNEL